MMRLCLAVAMACFWSAAHANPPCTGDLSFTLSGPQFSAPQPWTDDVGNTWTFSPNPTSVIEGILTCTPPNTPTPTALAPGTYNFVDPVSGLSIDDGFAPTIGLWTTVNDSGQRFVWDGTKLQCVALAQCGATQYVHRSLSAAVLSATPGTFEIMTTAGGYTIKETSSGLYLSSLRSSGAGNVNFSVSPYAWRVTPR
jgi:hypothetical protein